ncbi:hypothetical protein FGO68_gene12947 [Halteria grandinella]|uniref:Uncharacterized protein n=1 Tax=Halteria grandinella TaxID=5974 RepID=A0A8J8NX02_HALGN|nr:hypothetical protein FGO68_gene12947 [Halteria grandinella]
MFVKEEMPIIMRDLSGELSVPKRSEKSMIGPHFGSYMRPATSNNNTHHGRENQHSGSASPALTTITNSNLQNLTLNQRQGGRPPDGHQQSLLTPVASGRGPIFGSVGHSIKNNNSQNNNQQALLGSGAIMMNSTPNVGSIRAAAKNEGAGPRTDNTL